jgi:lambda family phage tail tape measure protein
MTEESIGTARLDLVADTSEFVVGVEAAKKATTDLGRATQQSAKVAADGIAKTNAAAKSTADAIRGSANAVEQNTKRQINSLEKLARTYGLTREEQIRYRIETQTTGDVQKRLLSIFDQQVAKVNSSGRALDAYGMSAKQTAAALRGVPAQLTDIFTGLATGQRPINILLQQGGQLKDMFGGIVPAIRAVGGAVAGLINPFTLTAAAVVGLGVAWNKANDEAEAFNKALILSGNAAGLTRQQLEGVAASIANTTDATQGKVSEALAKVAASGQFTAKQMQMVAQAAVEMQQATGQSIEKTVQDFASLKGDPLDGILKLNDAIGDGTNVVRFLTQAQAEEIAKLKEQGDTAGATDLAFKALFDGINSRAPQAAQQMSLLGGVLHTISVEAKQDLDAIVGFFRGADEGIRSFVLTHEKMLRSVGNVAAALPSNIFGNAQLDVLNSTIDAAKRASRPTFSNVTDGSGAADASKIHAREEAQQEFDRLALSNLSKREKLENEIKDIREKGLAAGKSQLAIDTAVANARARYAESQKKGNSGAGIESATSKNAIQAFEDQLKKEQGLIANQTQVLEANYAARNITVAAYYKEQKRLAQENTDVQVKALEGEIAALNARNVKGKVSIENATQIAQKEAELAKVRADGATKLEVLNIQEAAQLKQRQQLLTSYNDALKQTEDTLKDELDNQVLRISMGEREFEMRSRINQILRQQSKELLDLARARDADPANADLYDKQAAALEASVQRQVQAVRDGYKAMSEAQANWSNGAIKAFTDYADAANDVAGQTYGIFSDALHGLEDVFVDFFTKGKADWKGFFDGIAAEITRFVVRQQLSKLAQKFLPGLTGDQGDSSASALSGAAGQLAASATPLYGAAAALSASASALAAAGGAQGISGGATTGGSGGWIDALFSLFSSGGGEQWYANGGAFSRGQEVQAFAYGGVVSSPTNFGMSGGRLGLMGEAGPEAILPLHRGPDGKLGVRMEAANEPQRTGPTVVQQTVLVQGRIDSRTASQFAQATAREQNRASSRNR